MGSSSNELRKFGLVVGGVFAAIAGFVYWRHGSLGPGSWTCAGVGAPLLLLALVYPPALRPVHRVWMAIAHVLGWINTRIILGAVFYVVFTIARLFLAIFRKDLMRRRPDPALETYWNEIPPRGRTPEFYEHPF